MKKIKKVSQSQPMLDGTVVDSLEVTSSTNAPSIDAVNRKFNKETVFDIFKRQNLLYTLTRDNNDSESKWTATEDCAVFFDGKAGDWAISLSIDNLCVFGTGDTNRTRYLYPFIVKAGSVISLGKYSIATAYIYH